MFSTRFDKPVVVTDHARRRMAERGVTESLLLDLIETGEARYKDATRFWVAKHYAERDDNLVCAVAVAEAALVIKTIMHRLYVGV
jgi:hypothetical protein